LGFVERQVGLDKLSLYFERFDLIMPRDLPRPKKEAGRRKRFGIFFFRSGIGNLADLADPPREDGAEIVNFKR
jgi:hypothetical protein